MAQAVKTNIVPEGYQKAQLYEGDTMAVVNLREVFIAYFALCQNGV